MEAYLMFINFIYVHHANNLTEVRVTEANKSYTKTNKINKLLWYAS